MTQEATLSADAQDNTDAPQTEESQGLLGSEQGDAVRGETKEAEAPKEGETLKEEGSLLGKVPEKYEDFKLPEGYSLEGESREKFEGLARDLGFDQEKAQKAVDYMAYHYKVTQEKANQEYIKDRLNWRAELRKDPDFGGDKFDATVNKANMMLSKYWSKEAVEVLVSSGLRDHPEIVKGFTRALSAMSEDKTLSGDGAGQPENKSLASVMYPNQGKS